MNGLELLEKYPEAAAVIRQFYTNELVESLKGGNYPDEFKQFALAQPLDNEYIAEFINTAPRGLFNVFDDNDIFIQISVDIENKCFRWSFDGGKVESNDYTSRKETEAAAVEKAFEILNEKLCQTA